MSSERTIPHLRDIFAINNYTSHTPANNCGSAVGNPTLDPYSNNCHHLPVDAKKPSRKKRDNHKTLTSGDVKTLERHLSMKKTIRKKVKFRAIRTTPWSRIYLFFFLFRFDFRSCATYSKHLSTTQTSFKWKTQTLNTWKPNWRPKRYALARIQRENQIISSLCCVVAISIKVEMLSPATIHTIMHNIENTITIRRHYLNVMRNKVSGNDSQWKPNQSVEKRASVSFQYIC